MKIFNVFFQGSLKPGPFPWPKAGNNPGARNTVLVFVCICGIAFQDA